MYENSSEELAQTNELMKLVSKNDNISKQYLIFNNATNDLYGINIAKVVELLVFNKEIRLSYNLDPNSVAFAIAKIRNEYLVIVNFDKWLGKNISIDYNTHKIILICNYGHKKFGILINSVEGILNLSLENLYKDEMIGRADYIVQVPFHNGALCTIFDSDKLLLDVFPSIEHSPMYKINGFKQALQHKMILVAEDSMLMQKQMKKLFSTLENIEVLFFFNGKELLDRIGSLKIDDIGLIITDIEMPIMDGIELCKKLYSSDTLKHIPVIVHTNMSNQSIEGEVYKYGVREVVKKLDLQRIKELIFEYIGEKDGEDSSN